MHCYHTNLYHPEGVFSYNDQLIVHYGHCLTHIVLSLNDFIFFTTIEPLLSTRLLSNGT